MTQYKSADRRAWLSHYQQSGSIAATCRHFGISRSTFYKWLQRYDQEKPSRALRSQSRRRKTRPSTRWNSDDLNILAELDNQTGARLGAGRLAEQLHGHGIPYSRATVGRMLAKIRKRCLMCGRASGLYGHDSAMHALKRDLLTWELLRQERAAHLACITRDMR